MTKRDRIALSRSIAARAVDSARRRIFAHPAQRWTDGDRTWEGPEVEEEVERVWWRLQAAEKRLQKDVAASRRLLGSRKRTRREIRFQPGLTLRVGQVWEDRNPRKEGRQFVLCGFLPNGKVLVRNVKTHYPSKITLTRFAYNHVRGYRLVSDAPKRR